MTDTLTEYVTNYSVLGVSEDRSSYLLAWFHAMYTSGRILTKYSPKTMLTVFLGITSIGAGVLFLVVFPTFAGPVTHWITTGVIGFGVSALYPTGFTWAVRYIHLNYRYMSIILVVSCTGGMLSAYPVASYLESPTSGPFVCTGCAIFPIGIFFAMLFTTRHHRDAFHHKASPRCFSSQGTDCQFKSRKIRETWRST